MEEDYDEDGDGGDNGEGGSDGGGGDFCLDIRFSFLLPFFREEKMDTLITVECSRSLAVLH